MGRDKKNYPNVSYTARFVAFDPKFKTFVWRLVRNQRFKLTQTIQQHIDKEREFFADPLYKKHYTKDVIEYHQKELDYWSRLQIRRIRMTVEWDD